MIQTLLDFFIPLKKIFLIWIWYFPFLEFLFRQSYLTPSPHPFNSLNTPSMLPLLHPLNKHTLSLSLSRSSVSSLSESPTPWERMSTTPLPPSEPPKPHLLLNNIHGCSWALIACAPVLVVPTVLLTKHAGQTSRLCLWSFYIIVHYTWHCSFNIYHKKVYLINIKKNTKAKKHLKIEKVSKILYEHALRKKVPTLYVVLVS